MRRFLLLAASVLLSLSMLAGPVTREQAQEIASQFFMKKSGTHRAAANISVQSQAVLGQLSTKGDPLMYAVSLGNEQGFVIVSGDDRMRPVLAYSDKGDFNESQMPDNMRAWLQEYAREMRWLDAHNYQPAQTTHRAGEIKTAIAPLMVTTWDQGTPYNDLCPLDGGKRSVTGCVATAMAQVVYYNAIKSGMPETLVCDIPGYTTDSKKISVPAISTTDYPMNWSLMLPKYTGDESTEAKNAVARLMRACGQSVQMDYTSGESGAATAFVASAMKTYFGFDATTRYVGRDSYTLKAWTDLIYNELKNGRAVCYAGQSAGGGHAFVADGYDGDELFHINWGWSGSCDGYFALSVLNPGDNSGIGASSTNDGYSFGQLAIIGAQYGSGETNNTPVTLTTEKLWIENNEIHFTCWNYTGVDQSFYFGIGIVDEDDASIQVLNSYPYSLDLPDLRGYTDLDITIGAKTAYANKTLKLIPIIKLSDTWLPSVDPDQMYVEAVFDANGVPTLTAHPVISLETTSIAFTGNKYKDSKQPVEVTIKNNGDEYYGTLYFFASTNVSDKGQAKSYGGITIVKGGTGTMSFAFLPNQATTYYVWVATDEEGNNVIGQSSVSITVDAHPATGPLVLTDLTIDNADNTSWTTNSETGEISVDVYSKQLQLTATITNTSSETISGILWINILQYKNSTWQELKYKGWNVTISAYNSTTLPSTDFGTLAYGKYKVTVSYQTTQSSSEVVHDDRYIINLAEGYTTVDEAGNSIINKLTGNTITVADNTAAVDLSALNLSGKTVTPNSNPNTLYILSSSQTTPSSLSGKNVVKNGVAEQITLTDGEPFYSPIDFTANEITYTRTFTKFYTGGKNWSTIVLPFAADEVRNDLKVLPWDETNREFWLMEFSSENGSTVNFTTPTTLEANKPYIIALPGADYGTYSLVGHATLTFKATNSHITGNAKAAITGSSYKFVGVTTNPGAQSNIYALNEDGDGNSFKKGTATVQPFRAYFAPTSTAPATQSLNIHIGEETTALTLVNSEERKVNSDAWYTLDGRKLQGEPATTGIYIYNGKKYIK